MQRTVLITGATSGIGKATAEKLAEKGYELILIGRREEKLSFLQQELSATTTTHAFVADVTNREDVRLLKEHIKSKNITIDILINNAGLAVGVSPIQDGLYDDWDRMIDTNVKGLLNVFREFVGNLKQSEHSHIVNIASLAGKEVYPNGNVYCASKHAVDALSKGMRIDLNKEGVKVTNVAPGLVNTEFSTVRFKGDKVSADHVYEGFTPLYAEDIANSISFILDQPKNVQIADITILPTAQGSSTIVNK